MNFNESVADLKTKLEALEEVKGEIKEEKEALEIKLKRKKDRAILLEKEIADLKSSLTKEALKKYEDTEEKSFYGGLKIRNTTSINFDPQEALAWAKKSDSCLALDTKAFNTVAKTGTLSFVKVDTIPSVTFPKEIILED